MRAAKFPEANVVLQAPKGQTEDQCLPLYVFRDGQHVISRWDPDDEDGADGLPEVQEPLLEQAQEGRFDRESEEEQGEGLKMSTPSFMLAPGMDAAGETSARLGVRLYHGDFLKVSARWPDPTVIVVDGPYGVSSFPGDPPTPAGLASWYEPYIARFSERATPETTLWFWNTEVGWATVHPVLERLGWEYRSCHVWDKGIGHIAGNANSKTLRKFPVVTEVCVQYVRKVKFGINGSALSLRDWFRNEWARTGLPFYKANPACGVKNAATRKYLTQDHLWYFPPPEAYEAIAEYANRHGDPEGRPYYAAPGRSKPFSTKEWARMRAKFYCEHGVTNVWQEPTVRGSERLKLAHKCIHMNQKPLRLLELILRATSDPDDVVWEPFGGLCSTAIAAANMGRRCFSSEILPDYFAEAKQRLATHERSKRPAPSRSASG